MASLQRVQTHGYSYWRIVESRRVNGKPRPVPVMYLGSADDLLNRLLSQPAGILRLRSYEHGLVAALKAVADRLDIVGIIDRHVGKSRHALSVGTTLLLAAINRAALPRSKRGWAAWAAGTSINRLFSIDGMALTSQYFWDQMDVVKTEAIEAIENELTQKIVKELGIKLDTLFYDTTNFFTYIDSANAASALARRGHSKQHRSDLRQFGLALLVSRDGQLPLCSQVYEGNTNDCTLFPESLTRIRKRLESLVGGIEDITLVYDRGNNSQKNQAQVDASPSLHYVASLSLGQQPELAAVPLRDYAPVEAGQLKGVLTWRGKRSICDAQRTVVMHISEQLRAGQIQGLEQHLQNRLLQLQEWKEALAKPRSGSRTPEDAQKRIKGIVHGQHIADILRVEYKHKLKGSARLNWEVDRIALNRLKTEVFGKRILTTSRHEWSTEDIILAYRGQSNVESVFRQMKDPEHLAVRPQFHWTDQKIRVHTFTCLIAFLLCRIIEREARSAGFTQELSSLLDMLGSVRLAMTLRSSGDKGGRPRCEWMLEEASPDALRLYRAVAPGNDKFVYTPYAKPKSE